MLLMKEPTKEPKKSTTDLVVLPPLPLSVSLPLSLLPPSLLLLLEPELLLLELELLELELLLLEEELLGFADGRGSDLSEFVIGRKIRSARIKEVQDEKNDLAVLFCSATIVLLSMIPISTSFSLAGSANVRARLGDINFLPRQSASSK